MTRHRIHSMADFTALVRLACLLALLAGPAGATSALAQDPSAELAGGEDGRIVHISPEACDRLDLYTPPDAENGAADYVPGVAADGSPVASADLDGGSGYEPRRFYEFDVVVRPLGVGSTPDISRSDMSVAHLRIDSRTGAVDIDGVPVSDGSRHALAEACAELHHKGMK